jgi:hypothetical protein
VLLVRLVVARVGQVERLTGLLASTFRQLVASVVVAPQQVLVVLETHPIQVTLLTQPPLLEVVDLILETSLVVVVEVLLARTRMVPTLPIRQDELVVAPAVVGITVIMARAKTVEQEEAEEAEEALTTL